VTFATHDNQFVSGVERPRQSDLISIDALILLACLRCQGSYRQKAEVFHRVVSPEMQQNLNVTDTDLRKCVHFLISIATILEEMTREMQKNPTMGVNFKVYQDKIKRYEPTFDGMIEDFLDGIFGEFSNKTTHAHFIDRLAHEGWKYFDMANLNELFVYTLQKCGTMAVPDFELPKFDECLEEPKLAQEDDIFRRQSELIHSAYMTPSLVRENTLEGDGQEDSKVRLATEGEKYFQVRKLHSETENHVQN